MAEENGIDWGAVVDTGTDLVKTGMGLYENLQSRKEAGKLADAYWYGVQAIQAVTPPTLQDLSITLQKYVQQGRLTPEEAIAQLQEQSAMVGIKLPPQVLKIQYDTLNELTDIVNNKGLTPIDRAAIANIQTELDTAARGQRLATQQSFAQRGLSGSGMELVQQQMADQAAAQKGSQAGLNIAAQAQQRALDALRQRGAYATDVGTQELNRQKSIAEAQDAISRFNAAAKQQAELANVQRRQSVQEQNLKEKQRIADANVLQAQKQQEADAAARQTAFENRLKQATSAGAVIAEAGKGVASAQETKKAASGSAMDDLGTLVDIGTTLYGIFSDEDMKKDKQPLSDQDVEDVLNSLTGYTFKYKPETNLGDETHAGVMAQDLEETPMGEDIVIDTPSGKQIKGKEALSFALSALANINKRINDLEK